MLKPVQGRTLRQWSKTFLINLTWSSWPRWGKSHWSASCSAPGRCGTLSLFPCTGCRVERRPPPPPSSQIAEPARGGDGRFMWCQPCAADGLLRFRLWNLAHPSRQPPTESILHRVLSCSGYGNQSNNSASCTDTESGLLQAAARRGSILEVDAISAVKKNKNKTSLLSVIKAHVGRWKQKQAPNVTTITHYTTRKPWPGKTCGSKKEIWLLDLNGKKR